MSCFAVSMITALLPWEEGRAQKEAFIERLLGTEDGRTVRLAASRVRHLTISAIISILERRGPELRALGPPFGPFHCLPLSSIIRGPSRGGLIWPCLGLPVTPLISFPVSSTH